MLIAQMIARQKIHLSMTMNWQFCKIELIGKFCHFAT